MYIGWHKYKEVYWGGLYDGFGLPGHSKETRETNKSKISNAKIMTKNI